MFIRFIGTHNDFNKIDADNKKSYTFGLMTRNELTNRIKNSIKRIDPNARVILFGSQARGDSNVSSDWDILILTSRQMDEDDKGKIRNRLLDTELEAESVISSLIFSQDKWQDYQVTPLYQNILNEGIEL